MFLPRVLLSACTCLCLAKYVKQTTILAEEEDTIMLNPEEELEADIEQTIAVIDITFIDGRKRTCTGAIIHENVVITAGHCFMGSAAHKPYKKPELSASFVIIGTEQMFKFGDEQYLPIERVVTHPYMRGWDSDLALVHTFGSMTENNIGAIIALVSGRNFMHIEANLTIFSWGRAEKLTPLSDSTVGLTDICYRAGFCALKATKDHGHSDKLHETLDFRGQIPFNNSDKEETKEQSNEQKQSLKPYLINSEQPTSTSSKTVVRPLQDRITTHGMTEKYSSTTLRTTKINKASVPQLLRSAGKVNAKKSKPVTFKRPLSGLRKKTKSRKSKTGVRSWRRQLGPTHVNTLFVEPFWLVESKTCKKMIDRVTPPIELNISNIICYDSEDRYVNDADSGALVVSLDELVGITVGGIESQGSNIAIGLNISQYCHWIAENIPPGDYIFNCWPTHSTPSTVTAETATGKK